MTTLIDIPIDQLEKIPLTQLLRLKSKIDKIIEVLQNEKKYELIREFCEKAEANGISLDEFHGKTFDEIVSLARKIKPLHQKYTNPNNHEQTWDGFGHAPKWVEELLDAGKKLSDLT